LTVSSDRNRRITKEEYAFTLRENQKASNEMKNESRDKARKALEKIARKNS
jgi:hypothetical protein